MGRLKKAVRAAVLVVSFAMLSGAFASTSVGQEPAPGSSCEMTPSSYTRGGPPVKSYPNDPLFARQWALEQLGVEAAWARKLRGGGATVAVVDTGIDLGHPDLDRKLVPGVDLVEGGVGQPEDCPPGPQDEDFHGTAVAGVIAAETHNKIGIAGVAPRAKLMPVRVRETVGSTDFSMVGAGIRYAADRGAEVINLTGGVIVPIRSDPVLEEDIAEALAYAWSKGAVTVATAGNNAGLPWCQYPASSPDVICAAALNREARPASYSQFPFKLASGAAVRAPGGTRTGECESADDIWTTVLPQSARDCGQAAVGYDTDSGTTYATAHTAGVAAILAGGGLTNVEIVECLKATSSNRGSYDLVMGHGAIDAARATEVCL